MSDRPSVETMLPTDGPYSGENTRWLAAAASQAIRAANHVTIPPARGLEWPADVDAVLGYLEAAAAGMPQLLQQLAAWLTAQSRAGILEVAHGPYASLHPSQVALAAAAALNHAERAAEALYAELRTARQVTSTIGSKAAE